MYSGKRVQCPLCHFGTLLESEVEELMRDKDKFVNKLKDHCKSRSCPVCHSHLSRGTAFLLKTLLKYGEDLGDALTSSLPHEETRKAHYPERDLHGRVVIGKRHERDFHHFSPPTRFIYYKHSESLDESASEESLAVDVPSSKGTIAV